MPGRPKKRRIVQGEPRIYQFSPRGKPGRPDVVTLDADLFEAVRLADHQGQSQQKAAQSMGISQQTFSRLIRRAHKIMADALVNGKTIHIKY